MITIRGATTINQNVAEDILYNTKALIKEIINNNKLNHDKVIAIFFSCTRDITAAYPAQAAREMGFLNASLMCLQEMHVEGSIEMCIRICLFYDDIIPQASIKNIYLNDAVSLRPDLIT